MLYATDPVLSVYPCTSTLRSGCCLRPAATPSSTGREVSVRFAELSANVTPVRVTEPFVGSWMGGAGGGAAGFAASGAGAGLIAGGGGGGAAAGGGGDGGGAPVATGCPPNEN